MNEIHSMNRRPAVRRIVEQASTNGYRLRDLVLLCCESELITRK